VQIPDAQNAHLRYGDTLVGIGASAHHDVIGTLTVYDDDAECGRNGSYKVFTIANFVTCCFHIPTEQLCRMQHVP
jgi:hypothetical protein